MATPVKLIRNGHWEQVENFRGDTFSDTTVWYHVVEFDDGSKRPYLPGDPDLRDLIAEIENQNEAAASRYYEGGRDFSPPYEP